MHLSVNWNGYLLATLWVPIQGIFYACFKGGGINVKNYITHCVKPIRFCLFVWGIARAKSLKFSSKYSLTQFVIAGQVLLCGEFLEGEKWGQVSGWRLPTRAFGSSNSLWFGVSGAARLGSAGLKPCGLAQLFQGALIRNGEWQSGNYCAGS